MAIGEERRGKLSSAPDAGLIEHRGQVFLDCIGGDVQLAYYLTRGVSLQDQRGDTLLGWRKAVSAEKQGAELRRRCWLEHDAGLPPAWPIQAGGVDHQPSSGAGPHPDGRGG